MSLFTLHVYRDDTHLHALPMSSRPLQIGRAPHNDLVLPDEQISWHHASIWVEGARVWIRDLGSRNGIDINGERARGAAPICGTDQVLLGGLIRLEVHANAAEPTPVAAWLLEDLTANVAVPARSDRLHIGSEAGSDLLIDGAAPRAATLILHANGEIWIGTDEGESQVEPGESFDVAGRTLRVVADQGVHRPTVEATPDRYPYILRVTLNGATGPEAHLTDQQGGQTCLIDADNRAVLLYLLAKQLLADREAGLGDAEAGWCADDDVTAGVWGRKEPADANSLHVLVYRLRRDLKKMGFDPWFIEKRRKALRARLGEVSLLP